MKQEHYEIRYINKTNESTNEFSILGIDNKVLLVDEIFKQDKIVLLGNPGIGKTTELNQLFNLLWEKKDDSGLIPFFIDLKYFRATNKFEDLILYEEWKSLPSIVFILDGLDEIENLHDFISEFEIFTTRYRDLGLNYVLSCRTNIYEKYLVKISGFQTYYLQNLSFGQAKSILDKKYNLDIDSLSINDKSKEFIQSPFFLRLFADFYKKERKLPASDSEIWNLYINETIRRHKTKYIKKGLIQKPILINRLEKVAFVNELMQRNYISDNNLYEIFNNEYEEFTSNPPLLVYNSEQENWSFEHRQIQEFFVARVLLGKNLQQIMDIVKIENIDAIHPSLFNAITFLINLLDEQNSTRIGLINWLKENQIEILFKADSNRINKNIRIGIFQEYFKRECIDKTLWISTRRTFEVSEIGKFGDCIENFEYLKGIISEHEKYHFRVLYSAIELMKFFSENSYSKSELKKYLFEKLNTILFPVAAKSQILRLIKVHKLVGADKDYLNNIYELFKTETNKQLNNSLLSLISDEDNIDDFYEFLKHEYLLINNLKARLVEDEVLRGNRLILNKLILRLSNPHHFLEIVSIYFNNEIRETYTNDFERGLIEKCTFFINKDSDFLISLFNNIKDNYRFAMRDSVIRKIIVASSKQSEATTYFLNNTDIKNSRYFISQIIEKQSIEELVEKLIEKKISVEEIEYFRNNIGNSDKRSLAVLFNNLMEEKGVKFKEPVFSEEKFLQYQKEYKLHIQENFDILFDKKRLTKAIEKIFKENDNKIDRERLSKIRHEWYDKNGHGNEIDTSLSILDNLFFSRSEKVLSFNEVKKIITNDDFNIVERIRRTIEKYQNNDRELIISIKQKDFIKKWSLTLAKNIDFENVAKASGSTSFYYLNNYKKINAIFYFQSVFEFELPKEFLLKSIEFYEFDKTAELDESFYRLKSLVKNDELFDKQIVKNLNNKELLGLSKAKHIEYALDYELTESYQSIRKYLVEGESFFNERNKLEAYVNRTKDMTILKELCFDEESYIYWASIDLMIKLDVNKDFCVSKAVEYLEKKNEKFKTDAFKILLENNHEDTFKYFMEALVNEKPFSFYSIKFSEFDNIQSLSNLKGLFNLIYSKELDQFESSYYRDFFRNLITKFSSNDADYLEIQQILHEIKGTLLKNKSDLFHINLLIDDSKSALINSKSEPKIFKEAKRTAMEFIE